MDHVYNQHHAPGTIQPVMATAHAASIEVNVSPVYGEYPDIEVNIASPMAPETSSEEGYIRTTNPMAEGPSTPPDPSAPTLADFHYVEY